MAHSRPLFQGSKRHLVLGLDLGTTFSGVSYAIQDPGKQVTTQAVTRFPGQDKGSASIPTVIYYNKKGNILGVGAEDPSEDSDVDIVKVEWFKMLLRPKGSAIPFHDDVPSPRLPPGKDIVDVYADFYKYLFDCTKAYVAQTHESGPMFWDSLGEGGITFVLSHPNGWGGSQQAIMRRAIVKANLLSSDDEAQERVCFVPEGEASLHFCLDSERGPSDLKAGNTVMVIDAGGGTVDISTYTFVSTSPAHIKEATSPSCKFEGAVFVSQRARKHLGKKLAKSKFGTDEYLDAIVTEFDNVAKKRFKDAGADPINIKFSRMLSDNDPKVAIRAGKIKLSGAEVKGFFDPGVSVIIQAIEDQRLAIDPREVKIYFLVGGFASNEYLFSKIKDHLETNDLILLRPDCESKKAVAEGAVSYYLDHYVKSRMAKFTYGTSCGTPFIPFLPSHRKRMRDVVPDLDGDPMIFGAFSNVLRQGTQVEETTEFRQSYFAQGIHKKEKVEMKLMLHRGHGEPPEFIDDDEASFSVLCTVSADLKDAPALMSFGPLGPYFVQKVDLVFAFGLTELKAQLAWEDENGVEQRTHATPIYEDDFINSSVSSAVARTTGPSRS